MNETTVANVKVSHIRPKYTDLEDWMSDPNNVYVGRGRIVFIRGVRYPPEDSVWANPYKVGKDGTRDEVVEKYRDHLLSNDELVEKLPGLKGKTLGCWCKPESCHADILKELADEF